MSDYRRPGVYLEEVLQTSPTQQGTANAVAVFAGVAPKGDAGVAVRVDSWADYTQKFGGFDPITVSDSGVPSQLVSFLPYAVFSYYQNGGRTAYIVRVLPSASGAQGSVSSIAVKDNAATPATVFTAEANGSGKWGDDLEVVILHQALDTASNRNIFSLQVFQQQGATTRLLETFNNLSMTGVAGTRPAIAAVNDPVAGSRYITLVAPTTPTGTDPNPATYDLTGGADPGTPIANDLVGTTITDAMRQIDAPLLCSFQPFRKQDGSYIMPPAQALSVNLNSGRLDCFVVWDGNPLAAAGASYVNDVNQRASGIGNANSYDAIYCPWIIVPDPARPGSTIIVPPSGAIQGMMARIDATIGTWRNPAGLPAVLSTAVGCEVKFSDTDQGSLNFNQINVIRAVQGSGICVMGARTRKLYGPDRYVGVRRTLIYIEDSLKLSTQYAVFENNDQRLWTSLRQTARQILDPIWERGGLAGSTAGQAYYVVCDQTINTPQVVQSGEVRMEVGVALQYPAEFVVIRVTQFDSGANLTAEIIPGQIAA